MIQLIKSSFIVFLICAIYLLAAFVVGNPVRIFIETMELCLSEGCSGIVSLYVSLLFKWSSWNHLFIFYVKALGILYILIFILVLNENSSNQKDKK